MKRIGPWPVVFLAVVCLVAQTSAGEKRRAIEPRRDKSLLLEGRAAVRRALNCLQDLQQPDGSWRGDPAITALVVTAMMQSGEEEFGPQSRPVREGLECIRRFCKPDGGIYDRFYVSYSTCFCVMALIEADQPEDRRRIQRAHRFLLDLQADEAEGVSKDDLQYGGWGYEKDVSGEGMHWSDMSNTQFALDALKAIEQVQGDASGAAEVGGGPEREGLACEKALRYLERCQNYDGGFIYRPNESKAGVTAQGALRSHGTATYGGLKGMLRAGVGRDDPRVRAAYDWIRRHWSVVENPGLGRQGLYHYYQTMAEALDVYGQEIVVDAEGRPHDWRAELVDQLLKVQRADGSWVNENGRWMENIPELVTAYAVLALERAMRKWQASLSRAGARPPLGA